MKIIGRYLIIAFISGIVFSCTQSDKGQGYIDGTVLEYVDTRVGTAPSIADITVTEVEEPLGYVSPIVGYPSALTHWTPQTSTLRGRILTVPVPYWYDQEKLQGFRGTRYPNGAVVSDWGPISIMPMTGEIISDPEKRASKFSHDTEIAKPHYYSVELDDYNIKAELTGAAKTGFFQFTFPEAEQSTVLFDGVFVPGEYKVLPETQEIEGITVISGKFKNYFVAKFDKEFSSYQLDLSQAKIINENLIPDGLKGEYFNNPDVKGKPALVVTEKELNYTWHHEPYEGIVADNFSARYTGTVVANHSGTHTFELTTDDGTRMYVNDELVIDSWVPRGPTTDKYSIDLEKGETCDIKIEYFDGASSASIEFRCLEPAILDPEIAKQVALKGTEANAVSVSFPTKEGEIVRLKVATSLISLEQARANMNEEFSDFNFDNAVKTGAELWENELNMIEVEGTEDDKAIFYTALTKCFVNPRNLNEGGRYFSPFDYNIHEGDMYTDLSLWDTFRSLHPLWVILKPQETTDVINGMLNAYQQGGWMPKWSNPWYRSIMMGTHGDAVIADAYVKGIRGFDTEMAFEAMEKNANVKGDRGFSGRVGIEEFNEMGYVPANDAYGEPVARTLEFAYDDYAIAQFAKALGKDDKHDEYMKRSERYINVLDKETNLVRGKDREGNWLPPFDKGISVWASGDAHATEAYYRNHTLLVPHDVEGLAEFMGGKDKLEAYLDDFFAEDLYYVGDEFSMHATYMYNFIGTPWKTQKVMRDMLFRYFHNDVGGLPGNDDCGQVSSWYVFGAMGFYPACPGDPIYQLCSPVLDKSSINVGGGKTFTIIADNNSHENAYIQSATLNGKPYNRCVLEHTDLMAGGELIFEMGPKPNKKWGIQ